VLRNVERLALPILALVIAIFGAFGIRPFDLQYSNSQLIFALLGVLAIEAFVERADLTLTIYRRVEEIYRRVANVSPSGIVFLRRSEQEKLSELILSARKSIWIAGPSLDSVVQCQEDLRAQLENGREVRVLMLDPTLEVLKWYGFHLVGHTYNFTDDRGRARAKERLDDNKERLAALRTAAPQRFQFRVLGRLIWFGFVIIDAGTPYQRMDVQIYLYKTSVELAPLLRFGPQSDPKWMRTFQDQFDLYWSEATDALL
jgi:hypothetical protein